MPVTLRFRPLRSAEGPPNRTSSSASVRVFSSVELAVMAGGDVATYFAMCPRLSDDVGGANASVVDRVNDAASTTKSALLTRRDGTAIVVVVAGYENSEWVTNDRHAMSFSFFVVMIHHTTY